MPRDQRERLAQVSLAHGGPAKIHALGHHLLRDTLAACFVATVPPALGISPAFIFLMVWLVACICSPMYFLPPPKKLVPHGRALVGSVPFISLAHRLMAGAH